MKTDIDSTPLLYGKYFLIHEGNVNAPIRSSIVCDGKDFYVIKHLNNDYVITIDLKNRIHEAIQEWERASCHPHAVRFIERGEIDGTPYLVVEYVSNGIYPWHSLEACFRSGGVSPSRILYWLTQIVFVIKHCILSSVPFYPVITPANILIGADGRAMLTNFGGIHLSGILGIIPFIPATHLAPEQHSNPTHNDFRTCVYNFGITLYQAICKGQVPFTAELPHGQRRDALNEYQRTLLSKKTNWNYHTYLRDPSLKKFHSILQQCLDPNPDGRYRNIDTLIKDLERAYITEYDLPIWCKPVPYEQWPLFNRGAAYLEIPQYDKAARCFSACVEKTNHPSALLHLGLALAGCNKMNEAVAYLQQATNEYPTEPEFHYQLGMLMLKKGDTLHARESIKRARHLDRHDRRFSEVLGSIFAREQEYEQAIQCFIIKKDVHYGHTSSPQERGYELKELGYYEEALKNLEQALNDTHNTPDIELRELIAYCLLKTSRFHEAEGIYATIAPSRKDSALFWFNYGQTLESLHKYQDALSCYERAEELQPQDPSIPFRRGKILKTLMRLDDAVKAFDKVLAVNPEDSFALNEKGECLYHMNDFIRALDCFNDSLAVNPHDQIAMKYKAYCLISLSRNEEALKAINDALAHYPDDPFLQKAHGDILFLNKDYYNATKSYMQYLRNNYTDAAVWLNLAVSFINLGEIEEATTCINFAITIDPYNKKALIMKAKLENEIGNREEAVHLIIHYLSISPHDNDEHKQWIEQTLKTINNQLSIGVRVVRALAIDYARHSQVKSRYLLEPCHMTLALATICTKKLTKWLHQHPQCIQNALKDEIYILIDFLHENRIDIATIEEKLRGALKIQDTPVNKDMPVFPSPQAKKVISNAHDFSHGTLVKMIHLFGGLLLSRDPILEALFNTLLINPANVLPNLKRYLNKENLLDEVGEIEKYLNQLLPDILQKFLGNRWEEIVLKETFNVTDQSKIQKRKEDDKAISIIDAMNFGEKKIIIEKFWNYFQNEFPLDSNVALKPRDHRNYIINTFNIIIKIRNKLSHHRLDDSLEKESIIHDGILAVKKIKDCIRRRQTQR